ncbi:MAG: hypothetical protein IIA91_08600, partial [Chloroflexi bacterium]|nr:hypothetical protein [Chloroflexota bacterium]
MPPRQTARLDGVSIYYSQRFFDMRAVSLPVILVGLIIAACAGSAIAPGPTPTPTAAPTPVATPVPTPAFLDPAEVPVLTLQDIFPLRDLSTLRLDPSRLRTL